MASAADRNPFASEDDEDAHNPFAEDNSDAGNPFASPPPPVVAANRQKPPPPPPPPSEEKTVEIILNPVLTTLPARLPPSTGGAKVKRIP